MLWCLVELERTAAKSNFRERLRRFARAFAHLVYLPGRNNRKNFSPANGKFCSPWRTDFRGHGARDWRLKSRSLRLCLGFRLRAHASQSGLRTAKSTWAASGSRVMRLTLRRCSGISPAAHRCFHARSAAYLNKTFCYLFTQNGCLFEMIIRTYLS